MNTYNESSIINQINGKNAKNYITAHKNDYKMVPFDFIYKGIIIDSETRKNKGRTKCLIDIHGHIYIVGVRMVWQLEETKAVTYINRDDCYYFSANCLLRESYGACPSDCATFTKK